MSINLLDVIKNQVTGELSKQASSFLGESESTVTSALGSMMPALLGSVIQKSSTPSGAQGLMDMIGKLDLDSLGNIAGLFGGGASNVNGLLNSGGGIIESLLGNKSNGVIDLISNLSGMKSGSTSSLLKLAAPFLMGIIGKQIKGKGISFLTDMLSGQKGAVNAALPAGLGSLLNFADFGGAPKVNTNFNTNTTSGGGNNWMKWLLPALLALGLIYWLGTKGCGSKAVEATQDAVEAIDTTATNAMDAMGNATDSLGAAVANLFKYKLSSGFELVGAATDGIENKLITSIEAAGPIADKNDPSAWFNFDRLLFDTGKATLQPASQEQLKNIAEILKAFPKVKLKVGGYTDNVGDPKANLKLSTDRAFNVVSELEKLGVEKGRLAPEGYGDKYPVGDNTTEEGRQQNRRIAVRVTEK
jgi:outer membrane protein OmpA-like peptidoglycan-associated protein